MYNSFLAAVGHNADDIAETVIMNGITLSGLFHFDNFGIFKNRNAHTYSAYQSNGHFQGEPVRLSWLVHNVCVVREPS